MRPAYMLPLALAALVACPGTVASDTGGSAGTAEPSACLTCPDGADVKITADPGDVEITAAGSVGIASTMLRIKGGPIRLDAIPEPPTPEPGYVLLYVDLASGKLTAKDATGATHPAW